MKELATAVEKCSRRADGEDNPVKLAAISTDLRAAFAPKTDNALDRPFKTCRRIARTCRRFGKGAALTVEQPGSASRTAAVDAKIKFVLLGFHLDQNITVSKGAGG